MYKGKTKKIIRNICRWFVERSMIILLIVLGYIGTRIFNDGEFFGTTLILGILFLVMKRDEV